VSKKWNWTPDQDRHAVEMQAVTACRQAVEDLRSAIKPVRRRKDPDVIEIFS